jgi:hypothetical protein
MEQIFFISNRSYRADILYIELLNFTDDKTREKGQKVFVTDLYEYKYGNSLNDVGNC